MSTFHILVALVPGIALAFGACHVNRKLTDPDSRSVHRFHSGSSPAAGDEGPIPFARPRSRRPYDWELIAHGAAARFDDKHIEYVKRRLQ